MIISVDHKGLEWVTAVFLSQDKVGIYEIWSGVDQHSDNQKRFGLPSRLIAKTFVFRLIYGGSAYSYANDPEFETVGLSIDGWQNVIDEFYAKYTGLAAWHNELVEIAGRDGRIITPSGRIYNFEPYQNYRKEWELPRTKILNYPVQGFGADIVMLSRITLAKRMGIFSGTPKYRTKLINTVHDDIWLDVHPDELQAIKEEIAGVFADLPSIINASFGINFNLPTKFELKALDGSPV